MRKLIVACFVLSILAPRVVFAEDDGDREKIQTYLAGIELPDDWAVQEFDCSGKWRTDTFCELIRAASIRYHDKDDYIKSIWFAAAALRKKPGSRRALKYVGRSLAKLGHIDEAVPYLRRAADLEEAPYALNDYIFALTRRSSRAEVRSRAMRLAELKAYHDDDAWNWWAAAHLHYLSGRYGAAHNRAQRILTTDTDDPLTWLYHSWIMASLREYEIALRSARRAVETYESLSRTARQKVSRARETFYFQILYLEHGRGNLAEAERLARSLLRSDDEKWRESAAERLAWVVFDARGPTAALEVAHEHGVEEGKRLAKIEFWKSVEDGDIANFDPSKVGLLPRVDQFTRLVLLDDDEALEEWAAAQARDSNSKSWLEAVDFRDPECNALGEASLDWHASRADYADLWKQSITGAAFDLLCGDEPTTTFTVRRNQSPRKAELAKTIHKMTVQWVVGRHDEAYRAAATLPEKGPPVLHRFAMWVAAANEDPAEFERHRELARRGEETRDIRLADLYFALRCGRLGDAREIWDTMAPIDRYPMILPSYLALMGHRVVEAAQRLDADFAVELAEAWFRTDGALDRSIWQHLQKTNTKIASAP